MEFTILHPTKVKNSCVLHTEYIGGTSTGKLHLSKPKLDDNINYDEAIEILIANHAEIFCPRGVQNKRDIIIPVENIYVLNSNIN